MPALEIPSTREVAGLLLLLEAGQPLDTFALASRCLQPPQAPALGSGREADLTLLAGEAALAAAEYYRRERHFEAAARILQQGLQLLQRMGQLPELRERIHLELEGLVPFRVLDLLSRDPTSGQERQEGLSLLEQLVKRRGGLEGTVDDGFAAEDFQTFFRQIRSFLTVQEQIDLFERWSEQGSGAADFLATIALTASGFAQRKPERIATARQRLQASGREGIEPLLANLDLLLGDVDGASQRFEASAEPELRQWAERQSDDPLGRLCAWCRDWLSRDVLPGYRDLEADPDLEAYFSDRDVVAWVEREDRRRGRSFPAAPPPAPLNAWEDAATGATAFGTASSSPSSWVVGSFSGPPAEGLSLGIPPAWGLDPLDGTGDLEGNTTRPERRSASSRRGDGQLEVPLGLGLTTLGRSLRANALERQVWLPALAGLALVLGLGGWLLRGTATAPTTSGAVPTARRSGGAASGTGPKAPAPPAPPAARPAAGSAANPGAAPPGVSRPTPAVALAPLRLAEPDEAQLRTLLEGWLQAKSQVMAGEPQPQALDQIAREGPLGRLAAERRHDAGLGQTQSIAVEIQDLTIQERSPHRIAVQAVLRYSDSTSRNGEEVDRTSPTTLRNVYVFGRDGDTWRLAASRPSR
jgi:hypothetical protein